MGIINNVLSKIVGSRNDRLIKKYSSQVSKINALEKEMQSMGDDELASITEKLKQRIEKNETMDDILPEAFAVVRETAFRVLGQRHYDVQLIGGIVLHQGKIAEMRTGEGKTLVATLPTYLNAISGEGAHVITVNDYLAKRDAGWMGAVHHFLGLTVGCLQNNSSWVFNPDAPLDAQTPDDDDAVKKAGLGVPGATSGVAKDSFAFRRKCDHSLTVTAATATLPSGS